MTRVETQVVIASPSLAGRGDAGIGLWWLSSSGVVDGDKKVFREGGSLGDEWCTEEADGISPESGSDRCTEVAASNMPES
ncbi:hypothetical protein KSS87_012310 [Heliosperma pusillum]|nr:hypothetical protein KSS87_011041 [Heliosperma pusillum]KAH9617782.1 hypothetical protein KSS87_012310 [Heliosperma pusillum]